MAAKKNFKDGIGSVLQFISNPESADQPTADTNVQTEQHVQSVPPGAAADPPQGYKLNPMYIEKKTQNVHVLFQPSVFEKIRTKARNANVSVSSYIHQLCENDIADT